MKKVTITISKTVTKDEWEILKAFCKKIERLLSIKLVSDGYKMNAHMNFDKNKGTSYVVDIPPEEQISEFLMAFRFFYSQKEKTHFPKILRIIGKHADSDEGRKALKSCKKRWHDSLFGTLMQIKINEEPITAAMLLDLWFNAHYFHADEDKEINLVNLNTVFTEDFSKYMLLDSVLGSGDELIKVYQGINPLVHKHCSS